MINATPTIITALQAKFGSTVDVRYNLFLDDSQIDSTVVTVAESGNTNLLHSADGLYYDYIDYQIRVYTDTLSTLFTTAIDAEDAMRSLGFRLQGSNQLISGNMLIKIMTFRAMTQDGSKAWIN